METPNWLNDDYIQKALRSYYSNVNLKLCNCKISSVLSKGENYGGILNRLHVHYQLSKDDEIHSKRYILKSSLENDEFAIAKMEPYDIFNREISIYENILPKLQQILDEINDEDKLFPNIIYVDYQRQALIFEDLSELGFIMADRVKLLDEAHVQLVLRKLAKMHATSAILNERENGALELYDRGFFNYYTDNYSPYFVGMLVACKNFILKNWPDYKYYGKKLEKLTKKYMEIGKKCFEPTQGHVNTFVHGDVWTNNVMFKYKDGTNEPIDVLLIDFQYSFWGSPTLDLHHFLNTSIKEELRRNQQCELLSYYHNIFTTTLKKLEYKSNPIPSLHVFQLHAEQKKFFAFHSACFVQPVMINEDCKDADFNALMSDDERSCNFRSSLYNNTRIQDNLRNLLPIFDRRGLLDTNQMDK